MEPDTVNIELTEMEAIALGCVCSQDWCQGAREFGYITYICEDFTEDSQGNCTHCEHDEQCHLNLQRGGN